MGPIAIEWYLLWVTVRVIVNLDFSDPLCCYFRRNAISVEPMRGCKDLNHEHVVKQHLFGAEESNIKSDT